jgi:hypothetical protein
MKNPVTASLRLLGAAALSTLVAACGSGGGSSSSSGGAPVVPSDIFRITCKVVESVNSAEVPVDKASVIFNAKDKTYTTETNKDGSCTLDVPAADVQIAGTALTFPAASVVKDGYEPNSIVCDTAKAGTACDAKVVMVRLPANASIPENGDIVHHIGDDNFAGEPNSKFQRDTEGSSLDFNILDWKTQFSNPAFTRATVVLEARGWQTKSAPCANTMTVLADVAGGGSQTQAGGDSRLDGDWSETRFTFDAAQVGRSDAATLRIASGKCVGTGDLDDFEVNSIRVYFCGANGVDCAP